MVPIRSCLLMLILFVMVFPASGQGWKLDLPMEVPAEPGDTVEIDVSVTNTGDDASGSFLQRGFLAVAHGAMFRSVINSDPRVACALQGVINGNQVFTCFCDPITVPHGGKVTTKYTIDVPLSALPGTKIPFSTTFQYAGGGTIGRGVSIVVGEVAAPRLSIEIERTYLEYSYYTQNLEARWDFVVKNIGSAPTTGAIDIDVSWALPGGVTGTATQDPIWQPSGSLMRYRTQQVLAPQQTLRAPFELRTSSHALRGRYEITALVAGGGSPPDEAKNHFTPEDLRPRWANVEDPLDSYLSIFGRPR